MNIEATAFERLLEKVQSLCLIIEDASEKHRTKMLGDWIDNQEACLMLGYLPGKCRHCVMAEKLLIRELSVGSFTEKMT